MAKSKKETALSKPKLYDELVATRKQVLEEISLSPNYLTSAHFAEGVQAMSKMTLGEILYHILDPFNEEKWSKPVDSLINDAAASQMFITGRVDTGRETLGQLVMAQFDLLGLRRETSQWKRYLNLGEFMYDMFRFLNEGMDDSVVRGVVSQLRNSRSKEDKIIAEEILNLMKGFREAQTKNRNGGYIGHLLASPTRLEVIYNSLRKDVAMMVFRRKNNRRIAEKLAYRIVLAEEALYGFLFNRAGFEKLAEDYRTYHKSPDPVHRMKARRLKYYDRVYRTVARSKEKGKDFSAIAHAFEGIYREIILDDFFGCKINAKDEDAVLRIYNKLVPLHASSFESIYSWRPKGDQLLDSYIPGGFMVTEIDNHASVDRLSNFVQIKFKKVLQAGSYNMPDIFEVMIQTVRDMPIDLVHPEAGHFRYESERKAAIEDMAPWLQERFKAYSRYVEKLFDGIVPHDLVKW